MNKYSNKKARRNIKVVATIMLVLFVLNRIGNLLLLKATCSSEPIVIAIIWKTIVGTVTVGTGVLVLLIVCFVFYELYEHLVKRKK